jgi:hypothetical protein
MASSNGYGAVNGSGRTAGAPGDEEQPLLGGGQSPKRGWRDNMMANVSRDWADLVLLVCYVVTGLLDSASISTWGSFVSMQTGMLFPIYLLSPWFDTRVDAIQATRSILAWELLHPTSRRDGSSQERHLAFSVSDQSSSATSTVTFRPSDDGFYAPPS